MWRYLTYRSGDQHRTKRYLNTSTVLANTYFPVMSTVWAPHLSIKPHPRPKHPAQDGQYIYFDFTKWTLLIIETYTTTPSVPS
jgi:hypothetical protein